MNKLILVFIGIALNGCATGSKCQNIEIQENTVFNKNTCQVYLRNGFYLDQLSPNVADKLKEGKKVKYRWVASKTTERILIPAHPEVEFVEGD